MTRATPPAILEASFVAAAASDEQLLPPGLAEVAFAGRSNVGKSSLLNRLVGRHNLVRTGGTPGTTRQLNFFRVKAADELELLLVDLPGYGYAKRAKTETSSWGPLIEGYLQRRVTLRLLVLIVDIRRGVEEDDRALLDFVGSIESAAGTRGKLPVILVATKLDKLSASARKPAVERLKSSTGARLVGFSAVTGDGVDDLWIRMRVALGIQPSKASGGAGGVDALS